MKALTKISIGFLALVAVALWFTSCSSEDVAQNGGSQGNTYLTLSINTGAVSNTRASAWTDSDPAKTDENKINNMLHLKVSRLISKADGPYKSAEFTPTAFFMINVPEDFLFNGTVANKLNEAWTSTTSMYHAWNKDGDYTLANLDATSMGKYAQYLTTEALGITSALTGNAGATSTNTCPKKACFYVTPSATTTGEKNMKLVIAGTFKNGSTTSTVYYPVPLNANYAADGTVSPAVSGTTTYAVYPNVDYQCKVVIRSIGATTPNANLSPETATITVTVKDFVPATQNTEFN